MNNKIVLNRAAFIFFLFCFLLVMPFAQYIDVIFSSSISFFLIIIFGISHGALDHEKGYKLLRIYNIKNTITFYLSYISIALLIICFWLILPNLLLIIFLFVASYHFGKEDSEILIFKKNQFQNLIFLLKGSLIIFAPLKFQFENTSVIFNFLNFNIDLLLSLKDNGFIEIIYIIGLMSNIFFLNTNFNFNSKIIFFDLFTINILYYFLSPLAAFALYFCFIHSLRHSVSLIESLDKKNFKRGLNKFLKKALPLTLITGLLFILSLYFLTDHVELDEAIFKVIFIGLASLTFPHILLEYLLKRNEK